MEGFYSGIIMQACTLQREGIINEEEKLNLIEFGRLRFFDRHSEPEGFESYSIKTANSAFKKYGFICMPTIQP